jgi:CHAT domain-containing protein
MNFRTVTKQWIPRLLWHYLIVATTVQAVFGQSNDDPRQSQESGIAKVDHWIDYVRRTGDAKSRLYELQAAQSELEASRDLFLKQQDFAGAALSAIRLGDIQRFENQWGKGVPIYRSAIELAQRSNSVDYQTKALARLAYSELKVGETDSAGDYAREAVRLGANCGNKSFYFEALDVAGEIEVKRGNLMAAGDYLNRALGMSGEIDDKRQLYLGYSDRGDIYYQLALSDADQRKFEISYQSLELARTDYQEALSLTRELGYEFLSQLFRNLLNGLDTRKIIIQKMQSSDQTITDTKFSPTKPKDVLVTEGFAFGAVPPAMLALAELADKELNDFQAQAQQQGLFIRDLNPEDLFIRGQLAEMKGNDDAAMAAFMQAVDLVEKDRGRLRDEHARGQFLEDKTDCYYRPALLLLNRKRYSEAFQLFERARSRAMADLLAGHSLTLRTAQERMLFSDLQTARSNIAAQQKKLFDLTGSPNRNQNIKGIVQLENQIADLQQRYDQIENRIAKEAPRLKQLTASEPITLESLQRSAGEEGYEILYYVVLENAVIFWHIDGDKVQVKNVFLPHAQLIKKTTALRDSLVDAEANFDEQASRQLFLYLIQPVLSSIKSTHLIVVPHEELNLIPFQALQNPITGKYLGESFAISYAPSATVLASLESKSPLKSGPLLAVADPSMGDAKEEIDAIGKLYPSRSKVMAEPFASKLDVKTCVSDYNVVHLSVHGQFDASDPLLSYLQFKSDPPDDGRLTAAEMFGLPLQKNSLVVLSACETGRVQATRANELLGVVRSLLYAGAGNLVLSSWKVNAESTKLWMETFYQEGQTNSPAEAARLALVTVKSRPEYSHPFFWAPFIMTGK